MTLPKASVNYRSLTKTRAPSLEEKKSFRDQEDQGFSSDDQ